MFDSSCKRDGRWQVKFNHADRGQHCCTSNKTQYGLVSTEHQYRTLRKHNDGSDRSCINLRSWPLVARKDGPPFACKHTHHSIFHQLPLDLVTRHQEVCGTFVDQSNTASWEFGVQWLRCLSPVRTNSVERVFSNVRSQWLHLQLLVFLSLSPPQLGYAFARRKSYTYSCLIPERG